MSYPHPWEVAGTTSPALRGQTVGKTGGIRPGCLFYFTFPTICA